MVDGGQLLDVGLEERFGGGIVKGFDVGLNVAADALKRGDEAVEKAISDPFFLYFFLSFSATITSSSEMPFSREWCKQKEM